MIINNISQLISDGYITDINQVKVVENIASFISDYSILKEYVRLLNKYGWSTMHVKLCTSRRLRDNYSPEDHLKLMTKLFSATSLYSDLHYKIIISTSYTNYRKVEDVDQLQSCIFIGHETECYNLLKNKYLLSNFSANEHEEIIRAISLTGFNRLAIVIALDERFATATDKIRRINLLAFYECDSNAFNIICNKALRKCNLQDLEKCLKAASRDNFSNEVLEVFSNNVNLDISIDEVVLKMEKTYMIHLRLADLKDSVATLNQYQEVLNYLIKGQRDPQDIAYKDEIVIPRRMLSIEFNNN